MKVTVFGNCYYMRTRLDFSLRYNYHEAKSKLQYTISDSISAVFSYEMIKYYESPISN